MIEATPRKRFEARRKGRDPKAGKRRLRAEAVSLRASLSLLGAYLYLEQLPRFAAAFALAFLIGSKVLSPQYVIWLLPLVPLSAGGAWGLGVSAVFLAVCWMTTQIFPFRYLEVSAGRSPGTDILLGRNFLLLVLWGLMLSLPSGSPAKEPAEGTVLERGSPA